MEMVKGELWYSGGGDGEGCLREEKIREIERVVCANDGAVGCVLEMLDEINIYFLQNNAVFVLENI